MFLSICWCLENPKNYNEMRGFVEMVLFVRESIFRSSVVILQLSLTSPQFSQASEDFIKYRHLLFAWFEPAADGSGLLRN